MPGGAFALFRPSARLLSAMLLPARRCALLLPLFFLPVFALAQAPRVEFVWSGALQPESIRIVAGLSGTTDSVRVALTSGEHFGGPGRCSLAAADFDQRADDVSHHVVEKAIGFHFDRQPFDACAGAPLPCPARCVLIDDLQRPHIAHGRFAGAAT